MERVFDHYRIEAINIPSPSGPVPVERMFGHYRRIGAAPKHSLHCRGGSGGDRLYLMAAVVAKRRPTGTGPEEAQMACG